MPKRRRIKLEALRIPKGHKNIYRLCDLVDIITVIKKGILSD